ncbi:PQQ-binding-like beta-propeller repeat protein [Candidatus Methanoprimaticola sp. MG2]|uniref:outer membrane protein assembly factor BamB family protein n=1 Tax=Candidatus Methanoprimaticola sp. MG2 TaxID=3228838 RepID=UPI0039C6D6A9
MRRIALIVVAALLAIGMFAFPSDADDADNNMLLDYGNGNTVWMHADGPTYYEATVAVLDGSDIPHAESDGRFVSIGGMENHCVGTQPCQWNLYVWTGVAWTASDGYAESVSSAFAIGFYPDSIVPVETPDEQYAWTSVRGDSSCSGISDSYGTETPATPLEWYNTYSTGYVDSSIIVAGDLLYHTTGGTYGASGSDRMPWVYCLDRYTGKEVWSFMMRYGQGYEVTSPLVVGDMLVVTSTCWDVYLFDRFTGTLYDTVTLEDEYPMDSDADVIWDGRTFFTGGTSPVYDSGAIYFGTSDGKIEAYCIETSGIGSERTSRLVNLWEYDPPATVSDGKYTGTKGCFYYHAPVIYDVDGVRTLFLGSYEGYAYAVNASTGEMIWTQRIIDLRESNDNAPGTPGSVTGFTPLPDGRMIVTCSDGSMDPTVGFGVCVDQTTGTGPDGSEYYWKHSFRMGGPVVDGDGFICYVGTVPGGDDSLNMVGGGTMDVVSGLYKFDFNGDVIWCTPLNNTIKATPTLADGLVYLVDYSNGTKYPNGGGVAAYSAVDGSQEWKVRLEPFSKDSWSMVAATVIGGKIYTGNDYGAVYCISDVQGKAWNDSGEITIDSPGFKHWSWLAVVALAILAIALLYRYY